MRSQQLLKTYLGINAGGLSVLLILSILPVFLDQHSAENLSINRLVLIFILGVITCGLIVLTHKNIASIKFNQKLTIWFDDFASKTELYLIVRDLSLLTCIFLLFLIYSRYKLFSFLEVIWQPLPYYIVVLMPYLLGLLLFLISTSIFLVLLQKDTGEFPTNNRLEFTDLGISISIFVFFALVYWGSAVLVGKANTPSYSYFPQLAESFSRGVLSLEDPGFLKDLTLFNGRYYVSFPPLAALLMFPKVASTSRFGINTVVFTLLYSALTPALIFMLYQNLRKRNLINIDTKSAIWLIIFFSLGTAQWYMSTTGTIVHTSQILTATFLALSAFFLVYLVNSTYWGLVRSALLSGLALGLAMLSRPHVGFAWLFLIGLATQIFQNEKVARKKTILWVAISSIPIALCVAGLGWYNHARFGSVFDFGYSYMLVADRLVASLQTYGQFHPHFIWQNIKANWLGLPYWDKTCTRLAPRPEGMSIFLTTPGLIYLYKSFKMQIWIIGGWISTFIIIIVHMLYYNTGLLQFGYRFSLDFLVISFCLMPVGLSKGRLPKWLYFLIVYSIVINFIGVLWNAKLWCITW